MYSLHVTHGNDHHKTRQLYTMVAENMARPPQCGFPGPWDLSCCDQIPASNLAFSVVTLCIPALAVKYRLVTLRHLAQRVHWAQPLSRIRASRWYRQFSGKSPWQAASYAISVRASARRRQVVAKSAWARAGPSRHRCTLSMAWSICSFGPLQGPHVANAWHNSNSASMAPGTSRAVVVVETPHPQN